MHFLHRLLMNGGDLRFGLIKDRLDLRLLFGSQVQLIGDTPQPERMAMPVSSTSGARLCLHKDKAPKRDRAGGCNC
jgi:hypothetical protein